LPLLLINLTAVKFAASLLIIENITKFIYQNDITITLLPINNNIISITIIYKYSIH